MTTTRRPGLDVIRALAILLVVFHHYRHLPGCPEWLLWFSLRGYVGVDLFFVLSGWLIGGQLVRTYRATGRVEVLRFWIRRWFRTLPCYFVMLGVLVVLGKIASHKLAGFFFFLQNYTSPSNWLISWSLCVEEHFYIALPILFLLLPLVVRSKLGLWLAGAFFIFVSPLLRYQAFEEIQKAAYWPDFICDYYGVTHLRLEGLAIGVALAVLTGYRVPLWCWMERNSGKLALVGVTLAIVATWSPQLTGSTSAGIERMGFFPWVLGFFLVSIGIGLVVPFANQAEASGMWVKPITIISELAYTLYLVHDFGRVIVMHYVKGLSFTFSFALAFGLSMLLAYILRQSVEIPGLWVRDYLLQRYPFKFLAAVRRLLPQSN